MNSFMYVYWGMNSLVSVVPIIMAVAFFTLAERKLMAYLQRSVGPNVVGPLGLLQPIADALKLLFKESLFMKTSTPYLYTVASTMPFMFGFLNWFNMPMNETSEISNNSFMSLLYMFPMSLGGVAGVVLAGWSSGSKYATMGSYSGLSQLISYDIPMMFSMMPMLFFSGSLDFMDMMLNQMNNLWFIFGGLVSFLVFGMTVLAETNSVPFDLPEAEAELVAGFNVEYSSINFALFFLGEYSSMLLLAAVSVSLFLAGSSVLNVIIIMCSTGFLFLIMTLYEYFDSKMHEPVSYIKKKVLKYFSVKIPEKGLVFLKSLFIYLSVILGLLVYINAIVVFYFDQYWLINYFLSVFVYFSFTHKMVFLGLIFILVSANVPRYSFDQLLSMSWKNLLPVSLASTVSSFFILLMFNGFVTML